MTPDNDEEQIQHMLSSAPDVVAFGEAVKCPCGVLKLGPVAGPSVSIMARCPACDAIVEVAP